MKENMERALELFREGYNCAQSVFGGFAESSGLEEDTALRIATGFGAGMGRKQEVCGAVTGAVMVLGLRRGRGAGQEKAMADLVYRMTREFMDDFSRRAGSCICRELLGCDLLTDEGHDFFQANNLRERCAGYVETACGLLEEYLKG